MDNLEKALAILFRRVSSQDVINNRQTTISCKEFVLLMRSYSNRYSETELKLLYRTFVLKNDEQKEKPNKDIDVFQLLAEYSSWILTVQDDEIVVPYMRFFHWRNITFELDEDLLSTCYLARSGIEPIKLHKVYAWKTTLTHNNRELHRILNQGIVENHSHLKGAAVLFPLTWISIVNMPRQLTVPSQRNKRSYFDVVREIGSNRRSVNYYYKANFKELSFDQQIIQAAAIRLLLISYLRNTLLDSDVQTKLKDIIKGPSNQITEESNISFLEWQISKVKNSPKQAWLQNTDDISSKGIGKWAEGVAGRGKIDYAVNGLMSEESIYSNTYENIIALYESFELCGERWFLYSMFKKILGSEKNPQIENVRHLFYAYLLIKENFRAEFVQINSSVGFENFKEYEKRKDLLFEDQPYFEGNQVRNAIRESLFGSNVVVCEARIAPKSYEKMKKSIMSLDRNIDPKSEYRNRYYYTIHFIKDPEDDYEEYYENSKKIATACRHHELRDKCKKLAVDIVKIRDNDPEVAQRIRGIDAANMEIGCGPEVFAQSFRFLGNHTSTLYWNGKKLSQLRKTYHVGEDYLDMISGLRAIDEAVHFLGMSCGDRIGHAMVLGRDVDEWYTGKGKRILLPMEEYLDNLAWMHHQLIVHPNRDRVHLEDYIRKEYNYYFHMVYGRYIRKRDVNAILERARVAYAGSELEHFYLETPLQFDIETYYAAWKLRGDNPECYKKGFFYDVFSIDSKEYDYNSFSINERATKRPDKRFFSNIALLYYYYHYNVDVRREGAKPIEVIIPDEYIECVKFIQKILQKKIASAGICIETNPSSNYKISNLGLYEKHPIFKFYNRHLVENDEELSDCPQLNVSVNTDDAGIFVTSLENEYAYLALSLEKAKGLDGLPKYKRKNIYAWINDVRQMGIRQSFLDDSSLKIAFQEWQQGTSSEKHFAGSNGDSSKIFHS